MQKITKTIRIDAKQLESFFIRLTDNHEVFIHPSQEQKLIGLNNLTKSYDLKEGIRGACLFDELNANIFIEKSNSNNLEKISLRELSLTHPKLFV